MLKTSRQRLPGEVVFTALLLGLCAFLLWSAVGISGLTSYTSAGAFPMAAAGLMLVCSLIILIQTIRSSAAPGQDGETTSGHFLRRVCPPVVLWSGLSILVYMLTLEWIGFLLASYLFLVATMHILGGQRWVLNLVVSALVLAAIYVIFQTAFSVVLPAGTLWQGVFQ